MAQSTNQTYQWALCNTWCYRAPNELYVTLGVTGKNISLKKYHNTGCYRPTDLPTNLLTYRPTIYQTTDLPPMTFKNTGRYQPVSSLFICYKVPMSIYVTRGVTGTKIYQWAPRNTWCYGPRLVSPLRRFVCFSLSLSLRLSVSRHAPCELRVEKKERKNIRTRPFLDKFIFFIFFARVEARSDGSYVRGSWV